MKRGRSSKAPPPFRALAYHNQANPLTAIADPSTLIRSFDVDSNPARPVRPSPLAASTIRDMPLDMVDRIRSFPLFQSAPDDFLVAIGNLLKPQIHAPNDQIITEGDDARAMYWLVRGVVAVTSRDGEAIYAELRPGSFFGEIGVLMDMARTATIVSRTKCLLLVLKKEDLHLVMPKFPDMEKAIREEAQERLNLLKKRRQETGTPHDLPRRRETTPRATAPGEVTTGDHGAIKDGEVVNTRKRKSPSPDLMEEPAAGSAIGSGFVNIRKTLKELPLFSTLPPDILHFLGLSVQPKTYPPFTDIVRQGSLGNDIFFIVRGEAEVIRERPEEGEAPTKATPGQIQARPRLRPGQYFGEVSSLGLSRGRTATVKSVTTVECLMIPSHVLDELWTRCTPDIKAQVEETARTRYETQDGDCIMTDCGVHAAADKVLDAASVMAASKAKATVTTKPGGSLSQFTFSPSPKPTTTVTHTGEEPESLEPTDPDPFLSVNMEKMRNRRRHSLSPALPTMEGQPMARPANPRHLSAGSTPNKSFTIHWPAGFGARVKRTKTLGRRGQSRPASALPDAILVRIFQSLDVAELIRLRIIGKHWRDLLTKSPDICNEVDLSRHNRRVDDDAVVNVLVPFIGNRAVSINLNNCFHLTDEGFSALWRSCGRNVKQWRMMSVWDVSATQILEMSENAKELEEVDWSNCRKVGDNLLGRVVGWVVPPSPAAKKGVVLCGSAARLLSAATKQARHRRDEAKKKAPTPGTVLGCPKLRKLNLSYCKHITNKSMAHLAAHAADRLEWLSLTRCTSITDAGFQSWAQYRFEKLTYLCLADCTYLSDNAIVALVNACKNLRRLDLSFCCALSDTSTEVVALGLGRLRELRMAFCGSAVSDGSLESIALHLGELEGLSVRGCIRVTGRGVESVLKGCPMLKWIDVSQCRNAEAWMAAGGIARWGFDNRQQAQQCKGQTMMGWDTILEEEDDEEEEAMASAPIRRSLETEAKLMGRGSSDLPGKRRPVRFVVEKRSQELR